MTCQDADQLEGSSELEDLARNPSGRAIHAGLFSRERVGADKMQVFEIFLAFAQPHEGSVMSGLSVLLWFP